jgi:hypothetical protein
MAVTLDNKIDLGKTSGAASLALNFTISSGLTNSAIVVALDSGAGSVPTTTSVQWDATGTPANLTKQTTRAADSNCSSEHWGLKSPVAGTKQVKITMPTSVEITGGAASFQYVDQTTTAGFRANAQSSLGSLSTPANLTVNTASGDVVLFSAYNNDLGATNPTLVPTVGTVIHQEAVGTATHSGASAYVAATGSTQVVNFTGWGSGDDTGVLGSSIKWDGTGPSGGGGTVLGSYFYRLVARDL